MLWVVNYQDDISEWFKPTDKLKIVDIDDYTVEQVYWGKISKLVRNNLIHIENLHSTDENYYTIPAEMFGWGVNILNDEVIVVMEEGLILVWYNGMLYDIVPSYFELDSLPYSFCYKRNRVWYIGFYDMVFELGKGGILNTSDNFTYKRYRASKDYLIKRLLMCNDAQEVLNDIISNKL